MKSEQISQTQFTTTPKSVWRDQNSSYYPILIVSARSATIYTILLRYPDQTYARHPNDNSGRPLKGIYDVIDADEQIRLARYHWHDELGWLEEARPVNLENYLGGDN